MAALSTELVRIAAHIDAHAGTLRSRAGRLGAATGAAQWHSGAATVARQHLQQTLTLIGSAAGGLERAADELRAHARRVLREEQVVGEISRAGRAVEHFAARAVEHLR